MIEHYWRHLMITIRITEEENSNFSHHYGDQCLV